MTDSIAEISDADLARIQEAVAQAESQTAAEIVPVVAACSGRYDRAEDIVGLATGLLWLTVAWILWPPAIQEPGSWGGSWPGWQLVVMLLALLAGFVFGTTLASRWNLLRRIATPREEMEEDVLERACLVFHTLRLRKTRGQNALLLYISLYEHRAVVLADEGILAVLTQPGVDELCHILTDHMGKGSLADALTATIAEAGRRLAGVMARAEDDTNELPDKVILLP